MGSLMCYRQATIQVNMDLRAQLYSIHQHSPHWQYLYRRRLRWHGVSTKQIIASQLFTVAASVMAGLIFDMQKESLVLLAGALLLLPGIIDLAATLTGVLCAKINHQIDATSASTWFVISHAMMYALIVGLCSGVIVGAVGGLLGVFLFEASFVTLVELAVISMLLICSICYPVMALFTLVIRKLNMNPDNVSGPVESSVVDMVAIVVIALVAGWLR